MFFPNEYNLIRKPFGHHMNMEINPNLDNDCKHKKMILKDLHV